jgi:hypothetical protein
MTHDGQSAARVTGACFVMGEAAGTAAALAMKDGISVYEVNTTKLQDVLTRNGVFLG